MNECSICEGLFTKVKYQPTKYCPTCVDAVRAAAVSGKSMRCVGEDFGLNRNQVIGLINRNRPEGYRHINAGPVRRRIAQAFPPKCRTDLYGPPINPQEPIGCRFIEADLDAPWGFCQDEKLPGKSWCAHHFGRVYQDMEQVKAARKEASQSVFPWKSARAAVRA